MNALLATWWSVLLVGLQVAPAARQSAPTFPQYTVAVLDDIPGGVYPAPVSINNNADVLIVTTVRGDRQSHSYVWSRGVLTEIGSPSGTGIASAYARAMNNKRQVVGVSASGHAFVWQNGTMVDLGTLGGKGSQAWDINDVGQVVGADDNAQGERHAFLWDAEHGMRDLGIPGTSNVARHINEKGQVLGLTAGNTATFLWEHGRHTILAPALPTGFQSFQGLNLNDKGEVIGEANRGGPHGETRGLLYRAGTIVPVEPPQPCRNSNAFGLTSGGLVVGNAFDTPTGQHVFVWQNGKSVLLNDLLVPGTGWDIYFTQAVNDKGQIAACGLLEGKSHVVLLSPR